MKRTVLFLFLTAFTTSTAFAQTDAKYRKIDSLLNYLYANNRFMGSVSIREKDKVVFEKAYGFTDADNKIKANTNTKYKIGSITKMFTSTIIFQLIEEKKLTLDTKLSAYYPKVKNAGKITIADMLGHKSGIFNFTADSLFFSYNQSAQSKDVMIKRIESFAPAFQPGEKADYSNSNYLLLGYIIETITKKSYPENVDQRIVKRLGLKNTSYFGPINSAKNEAFSYTFENDKWTKTPEWHESVAGAAGAYQSTTTELTAFIRALFDGKLLKKESLDEMTKIEMGYGKGMFNFPFGERKFFGHNGGLESFTASLGYYPKEELSFSLIANGENYNFNDIAIGVLSIYYKLPYPFPNLKSVAVEQSILKSYEGIYSSPSVPLKIEMKVVDGKLMAQATGQGSFPLNPLSNTEFNFDPAGVYITFKPNGFTLKQGGMNVEFTKDQK